MKGGYMSSKNEWEVTCFFNEDGASIQEIIQKYFFLYFQEKITEIGIEHAG